MESSPNVAGGSSTNRKCAAVKKLLLLLFFFLCVPLCLYEQWITSPDFNQHAQRGIELVYNLDFEKAETEFSYLARHYPSHPAGKFFLSMIEWWKILISIDDGSRDDIFVQKMDEVIELCDSLLDVNENDVTALFFKGGALGFRGRLRANRNSWIKAANDGRLALPIVQKAYQLAPHNYDILLGIGIYNYYASTIPEWYPIVKPLMIFFPSGDKKKGIEQLTEASKYAQYAAIEAKYFLLQLSYNYEKEFVKAYELSTSLLKRFPNNVLFHRYVGRSAYVLSKYPESQLVFNEILARCERNQRGYTIAAKREAFYYLGLIELEHRRFESALKYLYQCDELSRTLDNEEPSGFMVMANLRIGMIYDIQKKRTLAISQYQKVLKLKKFESSHDAARKYLKEPFLQ